MKTVSCDNLKTMKAEHLKTMKVEHLKTMKAEHFSMLCTIRTDVPQIEADGFLRCMCLSLESNFWGDCNVFVAVKFSTIFKFCQNRVERWLRFATVAFFTVFKILPVSCECSLQPVVNFRSVGSAISPAQPECSMEQGTCFYG